MICHPERSGPIRFANRTAESKDPYSRVDRPERRGFFRWLHTYAGL
jgi:hypothetical protein